MSDNKIAEGQDGTAADDVNHARRKAIARMAAYTAPAMLAVLVSEKAMATSGGGHHHGGWGGWGGHGWGGGREPS